MIASKPTKLRQSPFQFIGLDKIDDDKLALRFWVECFFLIPSHGAIKGAVFRFILFLIERKGDKPTDVAEIEKEYLDNAEVELEVSPMFLHLLIYCLIVEGYLLYYREMNGHKKIIAKLGKQEWKLNSAYVQISDSGKIYLEHLSHYLGKEIYGTKFVSEEGIKNTPEFFKELHLVSKTRKGVFYIFHKANPYFPFKNEECMKKAKKHGFPIHGFYKKIKNGKWKEYFMDEITEDVLKVMTYTWDDEDLFKYM